MATLEEIFILRRDTRHFKSETVPDNVIKKALQAGHSAPSVGLTDATRYYIIKSAEIKIIILFLYTNRIIIVIF